MAKNEDEDEAALAEGEEAAGNVGGKKMLIIGVVLLLLIAGGVAGAYFSGMFGGKSGNETEEAAEESHGGEEEHASAGEGEHGEGGEEGAVDPNKPSFYELPEFLVNLNTGGRQASFLKMKVTLEVKGGPVAVQKVQAIEPRIVDNFQTYLRELRASDLQGSAGLYRLREELMLRVNKETEPTEVSDILFKEMIVQ